MATDQMTDISLDLETLGNRFNAPILSIGAQAFNRGTGKLGGTFYQEIDIDSALKYGVPTGSTILWWTQQSAAARSVLAPDSKDSPRKMHLSSALMNFVTWYRSIGMGTCRPWGNGATFDISILDHAIFTASVGLEAPWAHTFWCVRDLRTLVDAAEALAGFDPKSVKRAGTHHNALDDAKHQALVAIAAWAALKGAKGASKPAAPAKTPAPQAVTTEDDEEL